MDRVQRIWYLSPMRAAKVQVSLRIRTVLPEPSLLAHTSSESRGTFRQKTRSLAPLNGWACAVTICHDGMLEDTNSPDGAQMIKSFKNSINLTATFPLVEIMHLDPVLYKVMKTLRVLPELCILCQIIITLTIVCTNYLLTTPGNSLLFYLKGPTICL